MRVSIGLSGSAEQRWRQLEESWRAVARHPPAARPPYKAAHLTRCAATGQLQRTPSWHSFGSDLSGTEDGGLSEEGAEEDGGGAGDGAGSGGAVRVVCRANANHQVVFSRLPPAGTAQAPV